MTTASQPYEAIERGLRRARIDPSLRSRPADALRRVATIVGWLPTRFDRHLIQPIDITEVTALAESLSARAV